jgi:hypothetical protein
LPPPNFTISILEVADKQGWLNQIMPNPEQDLLTLASIFLRHPEIACQMDSPRWRSDDESWRVLAWLLQEYSKLVPPEAMFTVEHDEATGALAIVNRQYMDMPDLTVYYLPLSFLPEMATHNRALHDLLLSTAALLFKLGGLGTWDYESEMILEYWEEWAFDLKERLKKEPVENEQLELEDLERRLAYHRGIPLQYALKIHKVAQKESLPRLKMRVQKYQAKAQGHDAKWASWMMKAIALLESGFNLNSYSHYSEEDEGVPLQSFIQMWWNPDDELTEAHWEGLTGTANEYGMEMPVTTQVLTVGNTLTVRDFQIDQRFAELLALMDEGTSLALSEQGEQQDVCGAIPTEKGADDLRAAA